MNTRTQQINEASRRVLEPGSDLFKPLQVTAVEFNRAGNGADVQLEFAYRGQSYCFIVVIKTRTAPSIVKDTIRDLSDRKFHAGCYPMLMVPYLSQTVVTFLEEANVSGIDLNGNYLIQLPCFVATRLDRKNRYTEAGDIKKIYSSNSSMVGRFLLKENRTYKQITEIHEGIKKCGGDISLSTVSKVLTALHEDLIIEKRSSLIQVLQAEELLTRLLAGYRAPNVSATLKLSLPEDRAAKEDILHETLGRDNWIWDGATSVEYYAVTTPFRIATAYTRADIRAMDRLRAYEDDRFYNCVVKRTRQSFVYFDNQAPWSSPIECYLSLMQLDKREREIAQPLKDNLLRFFPR